MEFRRIGKIFGPEDYLPNASTYASLPFAVKKDGAVFRIYCSTRDPDNHSYGVSFDYDVEKQAVEEVSLEHSIIERGDAGLFDESGVSLSCYSAELKRFFYLGWSLRTKVPFSNQIGSGVLSENGLKIEKTARIPILAKTSEEPFSVGYPTVTFIHGRYLMYYDVILEWTAQNSGSFEYRSEMRYAESRDGKRWKRTNHCCLAPERENGEVAVSRPAIWEDGAKFHMLVSVLCSDGNYKLGYASSGDGITWIRDDTVIEFEPSGTGWDSDEISYPSVFRHHDSLYMLYNGNSYGKTGVGIAEII